MKPQSAAAEKPRARITGKRTSRHDVLADPEKEKRLAAQWEALPGDVRDGIVAQVNQEHGGLLRWPALMQPLYLERMFETFGENPPQAPRPSATEIADRIVRESGEG